MLEGKKSEQSMPEEKSKQEKKQGIDDMILGFGEFFDPSSAEEARQRRGGSSEAPRTEGTAGEPREERETRTEPQTRERMPGGYSAKEKIAAVVKGKDSKEAFAILLRILKQSPNQGNWLGLYPEGGDAIKKDAHKALLREIKYYIQGSDYERVKEKTGKGKPTPWRTNTNWHKADRTITGPQWWNLGIRYEGDYKTAWRELRKWAKEKDNIWDPDDEHEFIKETGGKEDKGASRTVRNLGTNIATGLLYGVGYGAVTGPLELFKFGLKYASMLTGDEKQTHEMMEKMFDKKKEKGKGKDKKGEWNDAKEYEVRKKVRDMQVDYLAGFRPPIAPTIPTEQERLASLQNTPEYKEASDEKKNELEANIKLETKANEKAKREQKRRRNEYLKAWRGMRNDLIREGVWNEENEIKFQVSLGYMKYRDDESKRSENTKIEIGDNEEMRKDFLTQEETWQLKDYQEELDKKDAIFKGKFKNVNDNDPKKKQIKQRIDTLADEIEKIKTNSEWRYSAHVWPPYEINQGRGGRRRRRGRQQEPVTNTEDDDSQTDN